MKLGETIKKLRKEKGWTQEQFSVMIGIAQNSLSQIEQGNTRPSPDTMKCICLTLKVNEVFLYYLSIDESDIPEEKKVLFIQMKPILDQLVNLLLVSDNGK